jgi:hypothetical protein
MYLNGNGKTSGAVSRTPRVITGTSLIHRKLTGRQKAALRAQINLGEVKFKLNQRQLAQHIGGSTRDVRAIMQLTPEQRQAIADGTDNITVLKLVVPPKPKQLLTDSKLADIISSVGINRMLEIAASVEAAHAA